MISRIHKNRQIYASPTSLAEVTIKVVIIYFENHTLLMHNIHNIRYTNIR